MNDFWQRFAMALLQGIKDGAESALISMSPSIDPNLCPHPDIEMDSDSTMGNVRYRCRRCGSAVEIEEE